MEHGTIIKHVGENMKIPGRKSLRKPQGWGILQKFLLRLIYKVQVYYIRPCSS